MVSKMRGNVHFKAVLNGLTMYTETLQYSILWNANIQEVTFLTELGMLRLYFHTNYIYIIHLIFAHGPADDGCNTIAGHLFLCLSFADSGLLLTSKQIRLFHWKSLRPFRKPNRIVKKYKSMYAKITELHTPVTSPLQCMQNHGTTPFYFKKRKELQFSCQFKPHS